MNKHVIILHGWSDTSESFEELAHFLQQNGFRTVPIFLGDYISLRNDIRIEDVVKRMHAVLNERMALPATSPRHLGRSFHMIVHSTGGLVARRWIATHYPTGRCPVQNLIMLAPAHFGSVLAHKGRSVVAKIFKGFHSGFETGDEMLDALELGSPFQWDLAHADLFAVEGRHVLYGADAVRPFVIVGTHPYGRGPRTLVNENGSDGTVRVAAANLNVHGMTVDFSGDPAHLRTPTITRWPKRGGEHNAFPLAVLPDRDHGMIKSPYVRNYAAPHVAPDQLGQLLLQALTVTNQRQYAATRTAWARVCMTTRTFAGTSTEAQQHRNGYFRSSSVNDQYFHEHYQVHIHAVDDIGQPVEDYFIAFMPQWKKKHLFGLYTTMTKESVFFHDEVLTNVHRHRRDRARISMYLDRYDLMRKGGFYDRIPKSKLPQLAFTVTASDPGERVAYFSQSPDTKRGLIPLHDRESIANRWLKRHCTHFIKLIIPRVAKDEVFRLRRA